MWCVCSCSTFLLTYVRVSVSVSERLLRGIFLIFQWWQSYSHTYRERTSHSTTHRLLIKLSCRTRESARRYRSSGRGRSRRGATTRHYLVLILPRRIIEYTSSSSSSARSR